MLKDIEFDSAVCFQLHWLYFLQNGHQYSQNIFSQKHITNHHWDQNKVFWVDRKNEIVLWLCWWAPCNVERYGIWFCSLLSTPLIGLFWKMFINIPKTYFHKKIITNHHWDENKVFWVDCKNVIALWLCYGLTLECWKIWISSCSLFLTTLIRFFAKCSSIFRKHFHKNYLWTIIWTGKNILNLILSSAFNFTDYIFLQINIHQYSSIFINIHQYSPNIFHKNTLQTIIETRTKDFEQILKM